MTSPLRSRTQSPETPKSQPKNAERKRSTLTLAEGIGIAVVATAVIVATVAYEKGINNGKQSRDPEVTNLHRVNHIQDWVIDNRITNVSKNGGIYEQNGNMYIQFEDPSCKAPVTFQYDEQQNVAVLNQADQAGNIYASAKITNAANAVDVVHDICT